MDINISANTLFHFTTSKEILLNILGSGIYVRYCLENYENLINDEAELVFPMACFCDIPLSQVKRHKEIYGSYAIGLTKSWGMKHKINPVIYTYPNSSTTEILNEVFNDIGDFFQIDDDELPSRAKRVRQSVKNQFQTEAFGKLYGLSEKLSHFLRYIKPYEGKFFRNGQYLDRSVKFYEEREWRFVPTTEFFKNNFDLKNSYKAEYYKDPIKRRAINIRLAKYLRLEFKPEDVRFIIVKSDKEIPFFLKEMESIFSDTVSANSLKLLGTRLISFEQIIQDL